MTDKYEDHATIIVPDHVEALEVNGRLVKGNLSFGGSKVIEIPVGRTEFVFRFYRIYEERDDHEKIFSDKMTAVFITEKNHHYEVSMPDPDSLEDAKEIVGNMKGALIHKETGERIEAIAGVIEERYHGIVLKKPYEELKYWWKKATPKEKSNFRKWLNDQ